jgi:hypothetical protein
MCERPVNLTTKRRCSEAGDESDHYDVDGIASSSERYSGIVTDEHGGIRPSGCLKTQSRSRDCTQSMYSGREVKTSVDLWRII